MFKPTLMTVLAFAGAAYAQTPAAESPAPAQADASSDRVSYDAAFFAQFSPSNAMDMVRRTPGFTLDGGDNRRGFSGSVGNVLIDGARPSVKSQSIEGVLSRIPASQVIRIELLRGAAVAGDASGAATLLNVVRTPTAGDGLWEAGFEITSRNVPAPRGELSWSGRNGDTEYGVGASYFSTFRNLPGERWLYDAAGNLTSRRFDDDPRHYREGALSANGGTPLFGGRITANAELNGWGYENRHTSVSVDPGGDRLDGLYRDFSESSYTYELGTNYERALGAWDMTLIGLANRSFYEGSEVATFSDAQQAIVLVSTQDQRSDSGETILRGTLARPLTDTQRIEFGAEGAYNSLDAALHYAEDTGGGASRVPIPNSNVLVEEERAETFVSHTWRPQERWSVESRVTWETSTLTFTGDANQSVDLSFWKPSLQVSRSVGENNQVRVRVYRDVGQLDFGDFVSAASIADDLIAGGNPDLRPETSWRAELGADLRRGDTALGLTLTRYWVEDVSDVVPITITPPDPDFDAPGNIGDGEAWGLEANLTLPLRPLIPGGELTVAYQWLDSSVTDPVTGLRRMSSGDEENEIEIEFRQDIPGHNLAWGVSYFKESQAQVFRFNEVDTFEEGPWVDVFIEATTRAGMKITAIAANVADGDVLRERRFFTPDRNGALERSEVQERHFAGRAPWFILRASGTF